MGIPAGDEALLAECDVETFRAGGNGGQHANSTDSAVRLRHRPSGIVVTARRERSQQLNREACLAALRRRLEALAHRPPPRRPTRPTAGSRRRRLEEKARLSSRKAARRRPLAED